MDIFFAHANLNETIYAWMTHKTFFNPRYDKNELKFDHSLRHKTSVRKFRTPWIFLAKYW